MAELVGPTMRGLMQGDAERWEDFNLDQDVTLGGKTYLCGGCKKCPECHKLFPRNTNGSVTCTHGERYVKLVTVRCSADRLYWLHSSDGEVQLFLHRQSKGQTDHVGHSHTLIPRWRLTEENKDVIAERALLGNTPTDILRGTTLQADNPAVNASRVGLHARAARKKDGGNFMGEITPISGRQLNIDIYFETKNAREDQIGAESAPLFGGIVDEEWLSPIYRSCFDEVLRFEPGSFRPSVTSHHLRNRIFPSRLNHGSTHVPFHMSVCLQNPAMSFVASICKALVVDAGHKAVDSPNLPTKSYIHVFVAVNPLTGPKGYPVSRTLMFGESRTHYCRSFVNFFRSLEADGHDPLLIWESGHMNMILDFHFGQFFGLVEAMLEMRYAFTLPAALRLALRVSKGCNRQHFRKNGMRVNRLSLVEGSDEFARVRTLIEEIPMYGEKELVIDAFREMRELLGAGATAWVRWWQHPTVLSLLTLAFTLNPHFLELCDTSNYGESLVRETKSGVTKRTPMEQVRYLASCDKRHYYNMKNLVSSGTPIVNRVFNEASKQRDISRKRQRAIRRKVDAQHKGPSSRAALARGFVVQEAADVDLDEGDDVVDDGEDDDEFLVPPSAYCDTHILDLMENLSGGETPFIRMMHSFGRAAVGGDEDLPEDDPEDSEFVPGELNPFDPFAGVEVESEGEEELDEEDEAEADLPPIDWDLLDDVHREIREDVEGQDAQENAAPAGLGGEGYFTKSKPQDDEFSAFSIEDVPIVPTASQYSETFRALPSRMMFISQSNRLRRARARKKTEAFQAEKRAFEAAKRKRASSVDADPDSAAAERMPKRRRVQLASVERFPRGAIVAVANVGVGEVVHDLEDGCVRVLIKNVFPGKFPKLVRGKGDFAKGSLWVIQPTPFSQI